MASKTNKLGISKTGKTALDELLSTKVEGRTVPALFFGATTADDEIYFACKGDMVYGEPDKGAVNEDTMLELYSMTKLVTSIACLQLYDRGLVTFDDPELLSKHIPELLEQPILVGFDDADEPILKPRTHQLTLRHLLTHTSGLAYGFAQPTLGKWEKKTDHPSWARADIDAAVAFAEPLLFEPGTRFEYSTGLDWAGILVSRITGEKLDDYFSKHIFQPCGITQTTFYPTDEVRARLMRCCARGNGRVILSDGMRNIRSKTADDIHILSGGSGLLGPAREYLTLLRAILASKNTGGIITPQSYALLFENALPPRGPDNSVYTDIGTMMKMQGSDEELYTSGDAVGFSLGLNLVLADSKYGRKAGSGNWGGAAKTAFWLDPTTGIAAVCCTQLLEMDPANFMSVFTAFERTLYDALEQDTALD